MLKHTTNTRYSVVIRLQRIRTLASSDKRYVTDTHITFASTFDKQMEQGGPINTVEVDLTWTSCNMFKMLQHLWSLGPRNISVVCIG